MPLKVRMKKIQMVINNYNNIIIQLFGAIFCFVDDIDKTNWLSYYVYIIIYTDYFISNQVIFLNKR